MHSLCVEELGELLFVETRQALAGQLNVTSLRGEQNGSFVRLTIEYPLTYTATMWHVIQLTFVLEEILRMLVMLDRCKL